MSSVEDLAQLLTAGTPLTIRVGEVVSAVDAAHAQVDIGERTIAAAWPASVGYPAVGAVCTLIVGDGIARVISSDQAPFPAGVILAWGGGSLPSTAWLWARGGTASRTADARLFASLGTVWGSGDGSTTFGLPDLRECTIAGHDAGDSVFGTLGSTVGDKSTVLTEAMLPARQFLRLGTGSQGIRSSPDSQVAQVVGSATPVPIVQPTAVANYIISR